MPEALACWLRAALHWAATDVPETLGPRVVAALTAGREGPPTVTVSDALRDNLLAAAAAAGVAVPDVSDGAAPTFVRAGGRRPAAAVGAPGWGVLVCNDVPTASRPATQPVRALLVGLLGVPELADAGAVVVDDRLGQEIAQTPEELLESALRLGVERVAWRGHATIELDGDVSEHLQATMRVQLASGVSSVDGAAVTSQRADAPAFVSDDDVRILEALSERPTVGQLAARLSRSPADLLSRLRALEEARIVYLQCSEDTCTRAGISWHSRASSPATSRL